MQRREQYGSEPEYETAHYALLVRGGNGYSKRADSQSAM
jgi:hypothetical protein